MNGKIYLSSEEYDTAVDAYRSQHGYDDMSDEEKEAFDERLDKVVGKRKMVLILPMMLNQRMHPITVNLLITVLMLISSEMI